MQWEHCSFCGNLNLRKTSDGMKKCTRCDWEGFPETKDMQAINIIARNYKFGNKWAPPIKSRTQEPVEDIEPIDTFESTQESIEEVEDIEPVQKSLPIQEPVKAQVQQDPRKSSFRMTDAEANKSENLIGDRKVSDKVPKNQELINRLKGKNFNGADFL